MNEHDMEVLETAWAISVGYDGYNDVNNLKKLIDEMSAHIQIVMAQKSEAFLSQPNAFAEDFVNTMKENL